MRSCSVSDVDGRTKDDGAQASRICWRAVPDVSVGTVVPYKQAFVGTDQGPLQAEIDKRVFSEHTSPAIWWGLRNLGVMHGVQAVKGALPPRKRAPPEFNWQDEEGSLALYSVR